MKEYIWTISKYNTLLAILNSDKSESSSELINLIHKYMYNKYWVNKNDSHLLNWN